MALLTTVKSFMLEVLGQKNGATTLSITTLSIMTLSIMGLVVTLSKNDTQHRHSA
jgi:hypothetical protein